MQTQAVQLESGGFIKNSPELEELKKETIQVDRDLADQELKSKVIMERYLEKRKREVIIFNGQNTDRLRFQHQFGIDSTPFSAFIRKI